MDPDTSYPNRQHFLSLIDLLDLHLAPPQDDQDKLQKQWTKTRLAEEGEARIDSAVEEGAEEKERSRNAASLCIREETMEELLDVGLRRLSIPSNQQHGSTTSMTATTENSPFIPVHRGEAKGKMHHMNDSHGHGVVNGADPQNAASPCPPPQRLSPPQQTSNGNGNYICSSYFNSPMQSFSQPSGPDAVSPLMLAGMGHPHHQNNQCLTTTGGEKQMTNDGCNGNMVEMSLNDAMYYGSGGESSPISMGSHSRSTSSSSCQSSPFFENCKMDDWIDMTETPLQLDRSSENTDDKKVSRVDKLRGEGKKRRNSSPIGRKSTTASRKTSKANKTKRPKSVSQTGSASPTMSTQVLQDLFNRFKMDGRVETKPPGERELIPSKVKRRDKSKRPYDSYVFQFKLT